MAHAHIIRLRIIFGIVALFAMVLLFRLYYLQISKGAEYRAAGEKQYVATLPNLYNRGTIYFKDKDEHEIAAATLKTGYVLAIEPNKIEDIQKTFNALEPYITIDSEEFGRKASRKDDVYEEIAKRIDDVSAKKIEAMKLPGVSTYRDRWRYYPSNTLASQVVGVVASNGEVSAGRYGIERKYDDLLSRKDENLYVNFFADMFLNIGNTIFHRDELATEADVVLTIEPAVEQTLEHELAGLQDVWHSESSGGIVIDPVDGRILAMATIPTFNPNDLKGVEVKYLANPLVENVYEMGSTMKPITMASGIDVGAVTAQSTYNDTGSVTLNNKTFSNYDGIGRGPGTSMQEVLNQSLNTGVAHVVSKMGNGVFRTYMREKFHIGDETGIDLPNETQGIVSNLESHRDIEYATASFGQGIAVTPINMAVALAALGNGGKLITPYVVSEIRGTDGTIKKITPTPPQQILKPQTSEAITDMLVHVVDFALVNGTKKLSNYTIAAKTGTAQIARPRELGGGYYDDRYMHTFFGYFPAYKPRFLVFLYTINPKEVKYASQTLTDPFMTLTKFLLNYYAVPPDRGSSVTKRDTEVDLLR